MRAGVAPTDVGTDRRVLLVMSVVVGAVEGVRPRPPRMPTQRNNLPAPSRTPKTPSAAAGVFRLLITKSKIKGPATCRPHTTPPASCSPCWRPWQGWNAIASATAPWQATKPPAARAKGGTDVTDDHMLSMALYLRGPQPARHRRAARHHQRREEGPSPVGGDRHAPAPRTRPADRDLTDQVCSPAPGNG